MLAVVLYLGLLSLSSFTSAMPFRSNVPRAVVFKRSVNAVITPSNLHKWKVAG